MQITERKVIDAIKLIWDNKEKSFEEVKAILEDNNLAFNFEEVRGYAMFFPTVGFLTGLKNGDYPTGASVVANVCGGEINYSHCREYLYDALGDACIGQWLRARGVEPEAELNKNDENEMNEI